MPAPRWLRSTAGEHPPGAWGSDAKSTTSGAASSEETITAADASEDPPSEERTTVILKNIPDEFDSQDVRLALDQLGFGGKYNACHVPERNSKRGCLGYIFVNFVSSRDAAKCIRTFSGRDSVLRMPSSRASRPTRTRRVRPSRGRGQQLERRRRAGTD